MFEISFISLAFKNSELIQLLKTRGESIRKNDAKNLEKMNIEIQKIKNDVGKLYEISRPINAFVTFKRIKAARFAKELAKMKKKGHSNSRTFAEHY